MSPSVRVALVESAARVTGSVRSLANVVRVLGSRFDFVGVGTSPEVGAALGARWEHFDFVSLSKRELLTFGPKVVAQAVQFRRLMERLQVEVVHVNDLTNLVPAVAKRLGAKWGLVYHVRLLPSSYIGPVFGPLAQVVTRTADQVLCVSEAVRAALPRHESIEVIPDAMEVPAEVTPEPQHAGEIRVLVVGNFHRGKGHDLAVDAFSLAVRSLPSLRLVFVGREDVDPQFAKLVRARVEKEGLGAVVRFVGPVTNPMTAYAEANVVLNLSESESFSMVVLEAMATGRAVIASRCGGPEELLRDPESGVLVGLRAAGEAAAALVALGRDAERRAAMGRRAHAVAASRFEVRVTAEQLSSVYQRLGQRR